MKELAAYISALILTFVGVEIFRRWSLRRNILDIPNERSSHKTPTPRGGGLIMVVVCMVFYGVYAAFAGGNFSYGYFFGAVLIAAVSWYDDLKSLPWAFRFLIHSTAALLAIYSEGFWRQIYFPVAGEMYLGWFGAALTFFWIVWLTNAYNFMDGIDGIAGMQALTAGAGWLIGGSIFGLETAGFYGGVIACSAFGFLLHNWQPAKIFMGDVGSAFLGYTFAVMPLLASKEADSGGNLLPVFGVVCVWLFVFDTLYTFFRRLLKGEKVWMAHRSHIYQRLVIGGLSHSRVTLVYGILSAFILAALIFWVGSVEQAEYFLLALTLGVCPVLIFTSKKKKIIDLT
jgi:UDP-N-acetylmuramyl pentapeptide phosphotransferase/UDP-N-acetylglucosamine-1-phosphate transferase